jgi:C3HC zinc finger-like
MESRLVSRHRQSLGSLERDPTLNLPPKLRMTSSGRKAADLSKTPHLAAILARTAAKTRKAIPNKFRMTTSLSSGSTASYEYRPSSTQSLLERLVTYKLNTYANKPPAIDALAAAKCGWVNDGKDRLVCGVCRASWVLAGREGMNRDAGMSKSNQL